MKILVYTPSDQPSHTSKQALDRHSNIMDALKEFQPIDHRSFERKSQEEKNHSVDEWDVNGNIIIAHLSDIHPNRSNILPKMLLINNAIGVFHCYDYPILNDPIVERLKVKPNIVFANSEKVVKNIKQFIIEFNRSGSLKSALYKLIGRDEVHESLLQPFKIISPLLGSEWNSQLLNDKEMLNNYLRNNK